MDQPEYNNVEVGEENNLFVELIKQIIPIKCSVKHCDETQENYPILVKLLELDPPKKAIIFVCEEHKKQQSEDTRIQYKILENLQNSKKRLKEVQKQDHDLQLFKANQKLDKNSCCMRENTKTLNLEKIFTFLQLLSSQDDSILFQLVKKSYIQQYFMYNEVKEKIKKAPQNPLAILHLIHLKNQLKAQQQKSWEEIVDSIIVLQPTSSIYDLEQNSIILGRSRLLSVSQRQE